MILLVLLLYYVDNDGQDDYMQRENDKINIHYKEAQERRCSSLGVQSNRVNQIKGQPMFDPILNI